MVLSDRVEHYALTGFVFSGRFHLPSLDADGFKQNRNHSNILETHITKNGQTICNFL